MNLWEYPTKIWQWPLFVFGVALFWMLYPLWFYKIKYEWKENTAFIIAHYEAIFYNPWILAQF